LDVKKKVGRVTVYEKLATMDITESYLKVGHSMTGINPRHKQVHLSLLPSGSDEVHDCLLHGDRSEYPTFR